MAFNRTNTQRNDNNDDAQSNDSWKAAGFINVTLTLPGQSPVQLPSMALKKDKFANLIAYLEKDPSRVEKLLPHITINYKSAQPAAKVFDFSVLEDDKS